MMGGEHLTCEEKDGLPQILQQGVNPRDQHRLSLKGICMECYTKGAGTPVFPEYREMCVRIKTFDGKYVKGFSPEYLAETGIFRAACGEMTCYQCGQSLRLTPGCDPLEIHADLFRNCRHVCRMWGRRPRSAVAFLSGMTSPSRPARRRLFSE